MFLSVGILPHQAADGSGDAGNRDLAGEGSLQQVVRSSTLHYSRKDLHKFCTYGDHKAMSPSLLHVFFACLVLLLSTVSPVAAADAGNVVAGLIGALVAITVILALIGWYARNRR